MNDNIPISLPTAAWNTVAAALGKQPYEQVFQILGSMQAQVNAHFEAQKALEAAKAASVDPPPAAA